MGKKASTEFRGVFFSCLHYTEQPPIMRKDSYGSEILGKFKWILDYAKKNKATVYCAGDLFHRKSGTSIKEIQRILNLMKEYEPVRMILGNHDIQGYNQNIETQPVGVLEKAGVVKIAVDEGFWQEGSTGITGWNYRNNYSDSEPFSRSLIENPSIQCHIHITHALLTNIKLPFECINYRDIEYTADIIVNGHYHKYWEELEYGIYNVGSVARVAMEKNEINKIPKILDISVSKEGKASIETVDVPAEDDVWRSDIKRDTLDAEAVEKFAKSIQEMDLSSDDDILNELLKDKPESVKEKVYSYLGE